MEMLVSAFSILNLDVATVFHLLNFTKERIEYWQKNWKKQEKDPNHDVLIFV